MNKKSKARYIVHLLVFFLVIFSFIFGNIFKIKILESANARVQAIKEENEIAKYKNGREKAYALNDSSKIKNESQEKSKGLTQGKNYKQNLVKRQSATDVSSWGEKKTENNVTYYISSDGTVSTEISGTDGIYWLKEESYDTDHRQVTSTWYGVDNSSGVFEPGSRLCVKWISKDKNPQEWNSYIDELEETENQNVPDSKKWLFVSEVFHPDGVTKYGNLPKSVPFYIQLGDDLKKEDIEARFKEDKLVKTTYINSFSYPTGTGEFMKLDLSRFFPCIVYDEIQNENKNYYIWIIVGGVGIMSLATLYWILYRKKKRNKENK